MPLARTGGPRRSTQHALPLDEGCGALALASVVSLARPARACGCFAPPSTLENVVQAGERILFAVRNGTVIAHVQIQYAGQAQNFGWLLPLPSVPTLKLGTDELFTELNRTTVPTYSATTVFACARQASASPLFGCSPTALSRSSGGESQDAGTVVVTRSSIGPYVTRSFTSLMNTRHGRPFSAARSTENTLPLIRLCRGVVPTIAETSPATYS